MLVPVILQTFNRIDYTMQVIAAINNHILAPHALIIIDNGSTDGTIEYLEFCKKQNIIQHLVLNGENKGIAEPKNQGIEIAKKEYPDAKYYVISDNDIVPPFVRDKNGKCCLTHITDMMDKHPEVGMCGVDLSRDNAPEYQTWWWKLRQHPLSNPEFTEISIGFWFSCTRAEFFKEFSFNGASLYGRVDESLRNWCFSVKKQRIGLWKGVHNYQTHETVPALGVHLGWREDFEKLPEYVAMKKAERAKAEAVWKETDRKW